MSGIEEGAFQIALIALISLVGYFTLLTLRAHSQFGRAQYGVDVLDNTRVSLSLSEGRGHSSSRLAIIHLDTTGRSYTVDNTQQHYSKLGPLVSRGGLATDEPVVIGLLRWHL